MFNIKNKIIRKTIFFIIIFIYNRKFILNASQFCNNGSSKAIYEQSENIYGLIAKFYNQSAQTNEEKAKLLERQRLERAAEITYQEVERAYQESAYCRKKNAELFLAQSKMKEAAEEYYATRINFDYLVKYYTKKAYLFNIQNQKRQEEEMLREAAMAEQESKEACKNEAHCREKYAELLFDLGKMKEKLAELLSNETEKEKEYDAAGEAYKNATNEYTKKLKLIRFLNIPEEVRPKLIEAIAEAYHYAGLLYNKKGKLLQSKKFIEEAILKYQESTNLFNNAIKYYEGMHEFTKSELRNNQDAKHQIIKKIAEEFNNAGVSYTAWAELLEISGKNEEAARILGEAAEQFNNAASWHRKNALAQESFKNYQCNENPYKQIEEAFNNVLLSYEKQKALLKSLEKYEEAKIIGTKASSIYEKIANTLFNTASFYQKEKPLAESDEKVQDIYRKIADIYHKAGNSHELQVELCHILNNNNRGEAAKEYENSANNYTNAILFYEKQKTPQYQCIVELHNNAAKCYEKRVELLKEVAEAERRKIAFHYDCAGFYYEKQKALLKSLKKYEEAKIIGQKALDIYKKILKALDNELLFYQKERKLAESHKEVQDIYGKIADVYHKAGNSHKLQAELCHILNNNNREEAAKEYENSRKAYSDAIPFYEKKQNYEMIAELYNNVAKCYEKKFELCKGITEADCEVIAFHYDRAGFYYEKKAKFCNSITTEYSSIYKKSKEAFNNAEGYYKTMKNKFGEFIEKAISSKNEEDIRGNYRKAYNLQPKETNNRIISLKRGPFKTTLPGSATISFLGAYYCLSNKSTIFEKLTIKCWQNEIIIGLTTTAILLATGIHLCINNNQHKELFRLHEERLKIMHLEKINKN